MGQIPPYNITRWVQATTIQGKKVLTKAIMTLHHTIPICNLCHQAVFRQVEVLSLSRSAVKVHPNRGHHSQSSMYMCLQHSLVISISPSYAQPSKYLISFGSQHHVIIDVLLWNLKTWTYIPFIKYKVFQVMFRRCAWTEPQIDNKEKTMTLQGVREKILKLT